MCLDHQPQNRFNFISDLAGQLLQLLLLLSPHEQCSSCPYNALFFLLHYSYKAVQYNAITLLFIAWCSSLNHQKEVSQKTWKKKRENDRMREGGGRKGRVGAVFCLHGRVGKGEFQSALYLPLSPPPSALTLFSNENRVCYS